MFRNALFASVIALGAAAGAAQAQAPDTAALSAARGAATGNVVGGASATLVGGGDNTTILYSGAGAGTGDALRSQPPRLARARNNFGVSVEYLEPETASPGREAWLVGGGDNAQVVYDRPY